MLRPLRPLCILMMSMVHMTTNVRNQPRPKLFQRFQFFRVRYEFNRPYLEAKDYQDNDALSVEATAYALQTLFLMEGGGVTMIQEQIVDWLNTMRLGDGGFISNVDTIIGTVT